MLLSLLLLAAPQAVAACPTPTTSGWLDEQLTQAEIAFVTDPDTTRLTTDRVDDALPCASQVLEPRLVGRLHRLAGLSAFLDDQEDLAARAFAAARQADGSLAVPTSMAPPGHALHELFTSMELAVQPVEELADPGWGSVRVNGTATLARATTIPVVVQQLDDAGSPLLTSLLGPGEPPPAWTPSPDGPPSLPPPLPEPLPQAPVEPKYRPAWGAVATGVVLLAGAGGLFWYAGELEAEYLAMSYDEQVSEEGTSTQVLNNTMLLASGGAAAGGAVLTLGGLSWWRR